MIVTHATLVGDIVVGIGVASFFLFVTILLFGGNK